MNILKFKKAEVNFFIVALIIGLVVLVLGILIYMYLNKVGVGQLFSIRNFFRFGE